MRMHERMTLTEMCKEMSWKNWWAGECRLTDVLCITAPKVVKDRVNAVWNRMRRERLVQLYFGSSVLLACVFLWVRITTPYSYSFGEQLVAFTVIGGILFYLVSTMVILRSYVELYEWEQGIRKPPSDNREEWVGVTLVPRDLP